VWGGRYAWVLRTSPAVDRIAPSIVITALRCADCSFWVNLTAPVRFFDDSFALCGSVNHTSAAYDILGIAMAMYSWRIPLADIPIDVRASRRTRLIQASADLIARCRIETGVVPK